MSDVRRIDDYVYLVWHGGECVAVCEDLATADQWIWRTAADPRDYYSTPKFLHTKGSLASGPVPTPAEIPAHVEASPRVGVTLTEYNRRWQEIMCGFAEGRLTPDQASAAVATLTGQNVWRDGRSVTVIAIVPCGYEEVGRSDEGREQYRRCCRPKGHDAPGAEADMRHHAFNNWVLR